MSEDKICERCGATIHFVEIWHKGYQGQEYKTSQYEEHKTEDCVKFLKYRIENLERNNIYLRG